MGQDGTARLLAPIWGEQFAAHPQAPGQLDSFTVLRMIGLVTGALGITVTKEMLMDLNAELSKVKI